jgi:hypothetical protein
MTGSLIHAAFDPQPYIVLSACSLAMGILLGVSWTGDSLRRFAGYVPRNPTRHAGDPSGSHSLGVARR